MPSPRRRGVNAGTAHKGAGENIEAGQKNPSAAMVSWMNSSGHRANILGNFTHLGIGEVACPSGQVPHDWTQDFLRR